MTKCKLYVTIYKNGKNTSKTNKYGVICRTRKGHTVENIKECIRENLILLRKENKFTQLELAEKIGYSDKAISRWEIGEVTPDVETLDRLATIYGVPISVFFTKNNGKSITTRAMRRSDGVKRSVIMLLGVALVWYTAILLFSIFSRYEIERGWMSIIWAIPLSFLVLVLFNVKWGFKLLNVVFISILSWTSILALYLQLIDFNLFLLFPAGAPIQAVIILSYFIRPNSKRE